VYRIAGLRRITQLALSVLPLLGCAINPPLELSQLTSEDALILEDVPFFPQAEFECGPAALAGVLGATGVAATPEALSPQVYLPDRQGSLQLELLAATRRAGRIPFVLDAEPEALLAQIEAGRPVLVLQNMRTRDFPVWHYAVVVGYDSAANQLYLNSASTQGMRTSAPEFLRTWDWAGRWAIVTLRPGELPADAQSADAQSAAAEPARFIAAVLDFEAVAGTAAALPAWESANQHWPREPLPYLALGNHAYAEEDLPSAAAFYRSGLQYSKQHAALTNNLASVLGELGCPREAEAVLAPVAAALSGDPDWTPVLAGTMAELAVTSGSDAAACASAGAGM
jgi:hypothetical protein